MKRFEIDLSFSDAVAHPRRSRVLVRKEFPALADDEDPPPVVSQPRVLVGLRKSSRAVVRVQKSLVLLLHWELVVSFQSWLEDLDVVLVQLLETQQRRDAQGKLAGDHGLDTEDGQGAQDDGDQRHELEDDPAQ